MRARYIGDEVTAAAYRLAGLDVRVVGPEAAAAEFALALREAPPLVLLGAAASAAIPPAQLDAAMQAFAPPVLIVADAALTQDAADLGDRVRGALGIGT